MSCEQAYNVIETICIIVGSLGFLTMVAAWCIIFLVGVIKWAVPEVLPDPEPEPDYESDPNQSPTPLTDIQLHYRQALETKPGTYIRPEGVGLEDVTDEN